MGKEGYPTVMPGPPVHVLDTNIDTRVPRPRGASQLKIDHACVLWRPYKHAAYRSTRCPGYGLQGIAKMERFRDEIGCGSFELLHILSDQYCRNYAR